MMRPERSLANRPSRRTRAQGRAAPDDGPCLSASTALVRGTGSPGHGPGVMPARSCACGSGLRERRSWHGNCDARLGGGRATGKRVLACRRIAAWRGGLVSLGAGVAPGSLAGMPRLVVFLANRGGRDDIAI
jgi:hypothetical protein